MQRTLKFVKYLPAHGWLPQVLTVNPERAAYPDRDPALLAEVPHEVEVIRTGAWDPYTWYARLSGKGRDEAVTVGFLSDRPPGAFERLARWVRANLFVPDARVGWVPYAIRAGRRLVDLHRPDALITTGPPHSTHLIGRALHRAFDIPWVADFRDPWTDIDYLGALPMSRWAARRNRVLEQSVVDEAQAVVTVSPAVQRAFAARTHTTCINIFNGYDEADFDLPPAEPGSKFLITHVGNMNGDRNPEALWQALAGLNLPDSEVRLVGNVDGRVKRDIERYGLADRVTFVPYLPHREAIRHLLASHVLLLPVNRVAAADDIIPGKVFEYLAARKPILLLGPAEGETARIVRSAGAGEAFGYEEAERVSRQIEAWVRRWREGQPAEGASAVAADRYTRRAQAAELAGLLNRLVAGSGGDRGG